MKLSIELIKNNKEYVKWLVRILLALFVVFTVNCKLEIVDPVYPFETIWGCFFMQFDYAFSSLGFADVLEFIAVVYVLDYIEKKQIKHDVISLFFAFIMSTTYIICESFKKFDEMTLLNSSLFQKAQTVLFIIGLTILLYEFIRIVFYLLDTIKAIGDEEWESNKLWIVSGFIIFMCYVPWMFMDYPGSFSLDGIDQLKQFFNDAELTAHHPPFSTMIIGGCVGLGRLLGNTNLGIFLYILLQASSAAVIYSYGIKKCYEWGMSKLFCIISICFFSVIPTWGCFVQLIEKSFIYNNLIVLFIIFVSDAVITKKITNRRTIFLSIVCIMACLYRNNGIYVIAPTLLILLFQVCKENKKKVFSAFIFLLVTYGLITKVLYPSLSIAKGSSAEIFSIPFMQTARYVYAYGDQVTEEEKEAINNVLWYDKIAERYESQKDISDAVKSLYNGMDHNLPEYLKTWLSMFFKHPNVYVSAFINNNYGYLAPVIGGIDVNMDYGEEEYLQSIGVKHSFSELPIKIFNGIHTGIPNWPLFKYFARAGSIMWAIIIVCLYAIRRKKYQSIVAIVPAILTMLICLASPSHITMRYCLCVMAAMPFYVALLVKCDKIN